MAVWLVAHGHVVWVCCLIVLVGLGVFLAWWRPGTRRAARRATRSLGTPQDLSTLNLNAVVTLSGQLQVEQRCARFEDGAPVAVTAMVVDAVKRDPAGAAAVSCHADPLSISHGQTRIGLKGPINVRVGSREYHPDRPLSRLEPAILARLTAVTGDPPWFPLDRSGRFRSLQHGDRVRVQGCLERAGTAMVLAPVARGFGASPALEMSFDGRPRLRNPEWTRLVRGLLLGLAAFVLLFLGGGELAYRVAAAGQAGPGSATAARQLAHAVAAATPLRRGAALVRLHRLLAASRELDLRPLLTVNHVLGRCQDSFGLLMRHGRHAEAIAQRERCPDPGRPRAVAEAYLWLGRFEEASEVLQRSPAADDVAPERWRTWAEIHLLAGHDDRAAVAVRGLVEAAHRRTRNSQRQTTGRERSDLRSIDTVDCLASVLAATRGSLPRPALDRLKQQAASSFECSVILWDARDRLPAVARAAIEPVAPQPPDSASPMLGRFLMLAAEAGALPTGRIPPARALTHAELLLRPGSLGEVADLGLRLAAQRRLAAVASPDQRTIGLRATLAAELSATLLLLGKDAQARKLTRAMLDDFGRLRTAHLQRTRQVEQLLASLNTRQLRLLLGDMTDDELRWLTGLKYAQRRVQVALSDERGSRLPRSSRARFERWLSSLSRGQVKLLSELVPQYRRKQREQLQEADRDARLEQLRNLLPRRDRAQLERALSADERDPGLVEPLLRFVPAKPRKRLLASLTLAQRLLLPSERHAQYVGLLGSSSRERQRLLLSLLPEGPRRRLLATLQQESPRLLLETCFAADELRQALGQALGQRLLKQLLLARRDSEQLRRLLFSVDEQQREPLLASLLASQHWRLRRSLPKELRQLSYPRKLSQQLEQFGQLLASLDERRFKLLWAMGDDDDVRALPLKSRQRLLRVSALSDELSRYFNDDRPLAWQQRAVAYAALFELRLNDPAGARKLLAGVPPDSTTRLVDALADSLQHGRRDGLAAALQGSRLWDPGDAQAWSLAASGSAAELARWLWRHQDDGARLLLLSAPGAAKDREPLRRWLRAGDIATCDPCALGAIVASLARQDVAARALNDDELSARLRQLRQRFARALERRQAAVPLTILEMYTPRPGARLSGG